MGYSEAALFNHLYQLLFRFRNTSIHDRHLKMTVDVSIIAFCWKTNLFSSLFVLLFHSHWKHLGTGAASLLMKMQPHQYASSLHASSLIAAIFHFKCLQPLGQGRLEAGVSISSHKHTPRVQSSFHSKLSNVWHPYMFSICLIFLLLKVIIPTALLAKLLRSVIRVTVDIVGIIQEGLCCCVYRECTVAAMLEGWRQRGRPYPTHNVLMKSSSPTACN